MALRKMYDRLKLLKDDQNFILDMIMYLNGNETWKTSLEKYEINDKIVVKHCDISIVNENLRESLTVTIEISKIDDTKNKSLYNYCLFNMDRYGEFSSNLDFDLEKFFIDMTSIIRKHRITYLI